MKLRKSFGAANKPKTIAFCLILFCLCTAAFAAKEPSVKTSSVATLSSFTFSPSITKNTVSGPDYRDYIATVPYSVSSITVFPVTTDPAATVKVNGVTVPSGSSSSVISLSVGNNTILTTVTASDGVTSNTYSIVITRQVSTVATLNTLTYNPAITTTTVTGPDYRDYTATVSSTVASINVTPLATDPAAVVKVNGVTVAYGAASASIPLNVGANTIATVVTAPDGVTTKTYSITITRNAPPLLSALSFDPSITKTTVTGTHFRDYTATVPNTMTSIKVIPTAATPLLTIKVNGVAVVSGSASATIPLNAGDNTISTVVTEADGVTSNTYSTVITRQQPAVATLNSLSFTPAITKTTVSGPDYRDYTATVANQVSSIKVLPVVTDPAATVKVNGTVVASGGSSASIPLLVGGNTITTVVTAADGITANTYKITITRPPSSNAKLGVARLNMTNSGYVDINGTNYQNLITTRWSVTGFSATVYPVEYSSKIEVNGVVATVGQPTPTIPLSKGPNSITITITAADGVTTKTYTTPVFVPTEATLSSFSFTPAVTTTRVTGPDFRDYTANVPNSVSSVKLVFHLNEASAVTATVNGTPEQSDVQSGSFALAVGSNTISIVVTANNGLNSNTYKIVITRQPSNEAILSSLSFSPNVGLEEVSGPGYKNYQTSVDSSISAIRVQAVPTVKEATMKVNGAALASGVFSAPIPLAYGKNTLTVTVTSAFGTVTHSYITTITRKYVATLSALHADNPYLPGTAISGADFRDYVADVPHPITSVKIIPTLTDPLSSVTVNGVGVASGTASPAIPLTVGKNTILIVVTARNRQIGNTYKIVATRLSSSAAPPAYAEDNPVTVTKPEIFVHTNLSPNGDGIGDKLQIDGIAAYPDNKLMIMNRSGALVYQGNGYDNVLKVFDGHSSVNGKLQQPGTYFYSFDYKADGQLKHKTGYIIIKY